MPIEHIHAYLIHPGRNEKEPEEVRGKKLPRSGKLFSLLDDIYGSEPDSRDFDITFNPLPDGTQKNECRDLLIHHHDQPSLQTGKAVAERLQAVTDKRSGIGLTFLIVGQHGLRRRLVLSRFPTDQAILAELDVNGLAVEFLEQVFIKRMSAYKALLLDDPKPSPSGFWNGKATDRQAGGSAENISDYWMSSFLNADFAETPAQGTRRLVAALKHAIKKNPNLDVKSQIASATTVAQNVFKNKQTSIREFCDYFGFSEATKQTIKSQLSKPSLFSKAFKFDDSEFEQNAPYRTVEMDNGAILTAPSGEFENVFKEKKISDEEFEYSTSGRVRDQRIARK